MLILIIFAENSLIYSSFILYAYEKNPYFFNDVDAGSRHDAGMADE